MLCFVVLRPKEIGTSSWIYWFVSQKCSWVGWGYRFEHSLVDSDWVSEMFREEAENRVWDRTTKNGVGTCNRDYEK